MHFNTGFKIKVPTSRYYKSDNKIRNLNAFVVPLKKTIKFLNNLIMSNSCFAVAQRKEIQLKK